MHLWDVHFSNAQLQNGLAERIFEIMETKKPCNIGPKEIRRRQATGMIALILTSILSVAFVLGGTEWYWYLILLLPSFGAMEGALQVKEKT